MGKLRSQPVTMTKVRAAIKMSRGSADPKVSLGQWGGEPRKDPRRQCSAWAWEWAQPEG